MCRRIRARPCALDIAGEHVTLRTRWNIHTIPTNGFTLTVEAQTFGYAGDTQYDPTMLRQLLDEQKLTPEQYHDLMYFFWTADGEPQVDFLYHEAGIPPIHTDKHTLTTIPEVMQRRTFLVHVADRDVPPGFVPCQAPALCHACVVSSHDAVTPSDVAAYPGTGQLSVRCAPRNSGSTVASVYVAHL